jgi:5-methylcytosine-specific restriction endonuclease McrA
MLCETLSAAVSTVRDVLDAFEPDRVEVDEAARLVETFAELERLAVAGRTIAGRRVEQTDLWQRLGYRTAAQWMAVRAQSTIGAAIATLETGRNLDELPATREAFRSGALSAHQAKEISCAANADPSAERSLLDAARVESVAGLRERCRQVIASAVQDPDADERLHRSRFLRHWTDADGAVRVDARLTPDAGARLIASVVARGKAMRDQGCRVGKPERREAYFADALVSLADRSSSGPRAVVHVHVDHAAWQRGHAVAGETCRIPGIGPVSVSSARRLASEGVVKAVLDEAADVRAVAHFGRTIPARLRTALEARDQSCVVPGCDERESLEIDHIFPLAEGGPTRLDNLARLCRYHHAMKTHRGWLLAGRPGAWRWFKRDRYAGRSPPRSA